jgi:hypothetical protein
MDALGIAGGVVADVIHLLNRLRLQDRAMGGDDLLLKANRAATRRKDRQYYSARRIVLLFLIWRCRVR